jgi:hypothetical protein
MVITVVSDDEKFDDAIAFVYRSWTHRQFDDVKLLFFGPSQRRLAKLDGDLMKMINKLAAGVVNSACIRYAEGHGIAEELARRGIKLAPYGERLATLLREKSALNVLNVNVSNKL